MEQVIKEIFTYLTNNYAMYLVVTMGLLITIINTVLMFIKKPIKLLTKKIANAKLRALTNKIFIVFAFGFSALAWYGLSTLSAEYFPFDEIKVLLTGAFSIVVYALGDGIVNSSQAKALIDSATEIVEDGKVDEEETQTATKEFWDIVK